MFSLKENKLSHITECLLCEVNVKGQVGFIIVSYPRADPEILKKGWRSISATMVSQQKKISFKIAKIT